MKQLFQSLNEILNKTTRTKKWVTALMVLVVFVTTYILILPAFTLTQEKAEQQGGIDVPAFETAAEEATTEEAASPDSKTDAGSEAKAEGKATSKTKAEDKAEDKAKVETEVETNTSAAKEAALTDSLKFEGDGFTIAVDDKKSVLPENTELVAAELLEKPEEGTKAEKKEAEKAYRKYYELAQQAVKEEDGADDTRTISFVKFYDITLQAAGENVQPDKPVNVTISYDKEARKDLVVSKKTDVRVVHFKQDENTDEIIPEILDNTNVDAALTVYNRLKEATFEAESFSVYGVVYTVDYEFEVDGKKYDFSLDGGDSTSIRDLLTRFEILDEDECDEFIENIESVEFSDPDYLWVHKLEKDAFAGDLKKKNHLDVEYSSNTEKGNIMAMDAHHYTAPDWVLISLKPFTTEVRRDSPDNPESPGNEF